MGTFRFPDRARVLRNLLISLESDELGVDVRLGGMLNRATPHAKKTTQRHEDKTEKFEFYPEHVKKVSFGEYPYPNGSPSEPSEAGSVSSAYPVRSILRKMTRKTIAQAITTLGLKVRNEEVRQKVELIFMRSFARNDSRARRAKAALQKALGENYQLIAQREEKLSFLIQPRAVGAVPQAFKDHASPRAKAMMQKVQKS